MRSTHPIASTMRRCPLAGASRRTRFLVAGIAWTAVGVMLVTWALGWSADLRPLTAVALLVGGVAVGSGSWIGMRALARKNIARLAAMPERGNIVTFITGKGWATTALMIVMGSTLRHSAAPKAWLVIPYLGMGLALFLASLEYYRHLDPTR